MESIKNNIRRESMKFAKSILNDSRFSDAFVTRSGSTFVEESAICCLAVFLALVAPSPFALNWSTSPCIDVRSSVLLSHLYLLVTSVGIDGKYSVLLSYMIIDLTVMLLGFKWDE